jgi:hypothetical protein
VPNAAQRGDVRLALFAGFDMGEQFVGAWRRLGRVGQLG